MTIKNIPIFIIVTLCTLLVGASTSRAETCNVDSSGKPATFYDGESAGYVYDRLFKDSKRELARFDYVPQGLAMYSNYDGGKDMLLVSSYKAGGGGLVIGIDPITGVPIGAVEIDSAHAGGIAVFEKLGWVFVSGPKLGDKPTLSRFALEDLEAKITKSGSLENPEHLAPKDTSIFPTSSTLTSHSPTNTLWLAHHNKHGGTGFMLSYKVREDGRLDEQHGTWETPPKVQGLVVTNDLFIFSTSLGRNNRSNVWVVRRDDTFPIDDNKLLCFRAPSMAEGIAIYGDNLLLIFESAADVYRNSDDRPRNVIPTWHFSPKAQLEGLPPRS
jgi:hypothetical protein